MESISISADHPGPRSIVPAVGQIYVTLGEHEHFPMKGWEDFSVVILSAWKQECDAPSEHKIFDFMDDDYRMEFANNRLELYAGEQLLNSFALTLDALRRAILQAAARLLHTTDDDTIQQDRDLIYLRSWFEAERHTLGM